MVLARVDDPADLRRIGEVRDVLLPVMPPRLTYLGMGKIPFVPERLQVCRCLFNSWGTVHRFQIVSYLKHAYNVSDEAVVERFLENPYSHHTSPVLKVGLSFFKERFHPLPAIEKTERHLEESALEGQPSATLRGICLKYGLLEELEYRP